MLSLVLLVVALATSAAAAQTVPSAKSAPILVAGGPGSGAYFMQPRWSPSGDDLAFTSTAYRGIWITSNGTPDPILLIDDPGAGFRFSWSPDGTDIATRVSQFEGTRRLNAVKVIDVSTGDVDVLLEYQTSFVGMPVWLSNEAQIVVRDDRQMAVLDVPGRVAKTTEEAAPVLLADGGRVTRLGPDLNVDVEIVSDEAGSVLNLTHSPDRNRVAFNVMGGNLFVMDADGGNRADLGMGSGPSWSPDGQWIVFERTEDDGHEFTASDLFVASSDGRQITRLTDTKDALEMNPSWSSDGLNVAFDDRGAIYLLPLTYE